MLVTAIAAGLAALALGRAMGRRVLLLVPATIMLAGLAVAAVGLVRGTLVDILTGPLGYANATAAFFVVTAAAAGVVRLTATAPRVRTTALTAAVVLASVPWLNRSRAGAVASLVVLAGLHPAARRLGARRVAAVSAALVLAAVTVTSMVAIAWSSSPEPGPVAVAIEVDGTRTALWHKAVTLLASEPLDGVGVGNFAAAGDPATEPYERFAHNDYLQAGAELGVLGPVLLLGGLAWLYRRLARSPDGPATILATLALTAVALHMTVDYVGHFPAVLAPLGALVGSATAARVRDGPGAARIMPPRPDPPAPARRRPGPGCRPPRGPRRRHHRRRR